MSPAVIRELPLETLEDVGYEAAVLNPFYSCA